MKKVIYFIMVIAVSVIVSGCVESGSKVKIPDSVKTDRLDRVFALGDNEYVFKGEYANSYPERIKTLKSVMHSIATFGLENGYKYMALLNEKNNNLYGFPFNDWKNLKAYADLSPKISGGDFKPVVFGKGGLVNDGRTEIKVLYFKEAHPGLFLWDLRKLKKDTAQ
jgi:hypothetical protein